MNQFLSTNFLNVTVFIKYNNRIEYVRSKFFEVLMNNILNYNKETKVVIFRQAVFISFPFVLK